MLRGRRDKWNKPGPLQLADHEWLHANDTTDTEESPKKGGEGADGDWEMAADGTSTKRAREEEDRTDKTKVGKTEGMGDVTGKDVPTMLGAAQAQGTSQGTGETPVNLNVTPMLGYLTETHTAILPLRFGVSMNKINSVDKKTYLRIRMNAPYNILADTTFVAGTEGAAAANGPGTNQAIAFSTNNPAQFSSFETTLSPAVANTASTLGSGVVADANCVPAWRKWFEKVYDSYHTIETHYRITIVNAESTVGLRCRVYEDKDVYTTSSTGNIMPPEVEPMYLNAMFKDVKTHIVAERNNNDHGWIQTIEGVWKPDTWSKNTLNAEDIKAWYATAAGPSPAWVENLCLVFRPDEFNNDSYMNVNVFVELRYIVQFKDLKQTFRYPQATDTPISLITPTDNVQVPDARNAWGSEI